MSKPYAIITDIDGTLADNKWRDPYDMSKVRGDKPIWPIIRLLSLLSLHHNAHIIAVTAREETGDCRADTLAWLKDVNVRPAQLLMRQEKDFRPDHVVKEEMYTRDIAPVYNVLYVLDDRNSEKAPVVDMWRSKGLTCLQVRDGNF